MPGWWGWTSPRPSSLLHSVRENNWPPLPSWCPVKPCFYQDFSTEIPADYQRICKMLYYLWMCECSTQPTGPGPPPGAASSRTFLKRGRQATAWAGETTAQRPWVLVELMALRALLRQQSPRCGPHVPRKCKKILHGFFWTTQALGAGLLSQGPACQEGAGLPCWGPERVFPLLFPVHSVTLFLNLLACLAWFSGDSSKGVDFGLSILWFLIFTPCAFLCWYRPIYKAFR